MHQSKDRKRDCIMFLIPIRIFSCIEFQFVVLMELQTIKDSRKAILKRIDAIDGGDGESNAALDKTTTLTSQEEFDREETTFQDETL